MVRRRPGCSSPRPIDGSSRVARCASPLRRDSLPPNARDRHGVAKPRELHGPRQRTCAEPTGAPAAPTEKKGTTRDEVLWPHYDGGFVLVPTLDPEKVPFRLVFNHVSQFRYTNTLLVESTYTDHFGQVREVNKRNDIQLTRDVFYFSGFVFNPRLDFNILLYTSSATLSATAAGYVGHVFDRAFALPRRLLLPATLGAQPHRDVPVLSFDRPDRPWPTTSSGQGSPRRGLGPTASCSLDSSYIAMIGNSLNTLDIAATAHRHQVRLLFAYRLVRPQRFRQEACGNRLRVSRGRITGAPRGHGVHVRGGGPAVGPGRRRATPKITPSFCPTAICSSRPGRSPRA